MYKNEDEGSTEIYYETHETKTTIIVFTQDCVLKCFVIILEIIAILFMLNIDKMLITTARVYIDYDFHFLFNFVMRAVNCVM